MKILRELCIRRNASKSPDAFLPTPTDEQSQARTRLHHGAGKSRLFCKNAREIFLLGTKYRCRRKKVFSKTDLRKNRKSNPYGLLFDVFLHFLICRSDREPLRASFCTLRCVIRSAPILCRDPPGFRKDGSLLPDRYVREPLSLVPLPPVLPLCGF